GGRARAGHVAPGRGIAAIVNVAARTKRRWRMITTATSSNEVKEAARPAAAPGPAAKPSRLRHAPGGGGLGPEAGREAQRPGGAGRGGAAAGRGDPGGPRRGAHAEPGGRSLGRVAAALLPTGDAGDAGPGRRLRTAAARPGAQCRHGADRLKAPARTAAAGAKPAADAGAAGPAPRRAGAA